MNRFARRSLLNALGLLAAVVFAFPVYWMVISAFKDRNDIQTYETVFLPVPTLDNFARAVNAPHFMEYLGNSLFVTFATLALALEDDGTISVLAEGEALLSRAGVTPVSA